MKQKKWNWKKLTLICMTIAMCFAVFAMPVAATDGATNAVWDLVEIISGIFKAIGVIACLISIAFLGASISSHDTSQRISAGLGLVAGLLVFFAPDILSLIGVGKGS